MLPQFFGQHCLSKDINSSESFARHLSQMKRRYHGLYNPKKARLGGCRARERHSSSTAAIELESHPSALVIEFAW